MSEPFIGEIRMFAFGYEPAGWAPCEGQLLQIGHYQALFSLLGNTYGGDGRVTFALPDLRGRVPVHTGPAIPYGQAGGKAAHTLSLGEMPAHSHMVQAGTSAPQTGKAAGQVWTQSNSNPFSSSANTGMAANALSSAGKDAAHENHQPYRIVSYCIALNGIFPSRN